MGTGWALCLSPISASRWSPAVGRFQNLTPISVGLGNDDLSTLVCLRCSVKVRKMSLSRTKLLDLLILGRVNNRTFFRPIMANPLGQEVLAYQGALGNTVGAPFNPLRLQLLAGDLRTARVCNGCAPCITWILTCPSPVRQEPPPVPHWPQSKQHLANRPAWKFSDESSLHGFVHGYPVSSTLTGAWLYLRRALVSPEGDPMSVLSAF